MNSLETSSTPFASHRLNWVMQPNRRGGRLPRHRVIQEAEFERGEKKTDVSPHAANATCGAVPAHEVDASAKAEFRLGRSKWPSRAPHISGRNISAIKTPRGSRSME